MVFTDSEYRILLSALSRERDICKQVDEEMTHEPYEVLLTDLCDSISRKIKKIQYEPEKKSYTGRILVNANSFEFVAPKNADHNEIERLARCAAFDTYAIEIDYEVNDERRS